MNGLMMDYPLTLSTIFRRAEAIYPRQEIVTRLADKSWHRYTFAEFAAHARRLAGALRDLGIRPGDRVATLGWNHSQHLEAYFAIPLIGGVLHTLNLRLHPDELAYIVNHAEDRAVIVDASLLPLWEKVRPQVKVPIEIVVGGPSTPLGTGAQPAGAHDFQSLAASTPPLADPAEPDENTAVAMCYTTGTTGAPKGV